MAGGNGRQLRRVRGAARGIAQKRQRGQAAVFVLLFIPVLLVALFFLYKAGKITSDKMEMQNAADAAAFSVSVVEARDLNFASYMNRAIVANEVAAGQLVGLASWAFHWRSYNDYLSAYATPLKPTPLAPLAGVLEGIGKFFKISGDVAVKIMKPLAKYGTLITHNVNKFYGYAQYGFHLTSTLYALGQVQEMIDQNAPDGARLSEFGLLTLIGHLGTYGALPSLPGEQFTRNYDPTATSPVADFQADVAGDSDAGGYGRLAAIIYDSSDLFTKQRGWIFDMFKIMRDYTGLPPDPFYSEDTGATGETRGWAGIDVGSNINLGIFEVEWQFWLLIHIDFTRSGGSELRMVVPLSGSSADMAAGQFFNWSGADTANLGLGLKGGFSVKAWIIIPIIDERIKVVDVGASIKVVDDRLRIFVNLFGSGSGCEPDDGDDSTVEECGDVEGEEGLEIVSVPFPTKFPVSAGFAQAGVKKGTGAAAVDNFLTANPSGSEFPHMGAEVSAALTGPVPREAYGTAANNMLAWEFPVPPGIFYQAGMADHRVADKYGGLPRYVDTANNRPLYGSGGPNLLIGVVQGETEFDLGNASAGGVRSKEVEPTGRLELT
ncbi:MAG: pilus assembly protein, partial [Gammaproteobacteria bacterium]|nr:pilus assembly protein [Gammaproteobacteria bacterium]